MSAPVSDLGSNSRLNEAIVTKHSAEATQVVSSQLIILIAT